MGEGEIRFEPQIHIHIYILSLSLSLSLSPYIYIYIWDLKFIVLWLNDIVKTLMKKYCRVEGSKNICWVLDLVRGRLVV